MSTLAQGLKIGEMIGMGWSTEPHEDDVAQSADVRIGGPYAMHKAAGAVTSHALVMPDGTVAITCPRCGRASHNAQDVLNQFCVSCGWHDDLDGGTT